MAEAAGAARLAFVQSLVRSRAGLTLAPDKEYFIESRLGALARRRGLADAGEVVRRVMGDPDGGLAGEAVESLTVQETSFFRDLHPFTDLRDVILPELLAATAAEPGPVVVWSAGCSSGQEPYSIAMAVRDRFPAVAAAGRVRIIATDLSGEAVTRAREGRYTGLEVNRGLPAAYLVKFLEAEGTGWRVRPDIRAMVEVRRGNLAAPLAPVARAHVIFARYVLMYMHLDARRAALEMFRRTLAPGGLLVLGGTESLIGVSEGFVRSPSATRAWYRPLGR